MSTNVLEWLGKPTSKHGSIAQASDSRSYTIKRINTGRFLGECTHKHGRKELVAIKDDMQKLIEDCDTHNKNTELTAARFV